MSGQPTESKPRARDLGLSFPGESGPANSITDVAGITVGHATLLSGDASLAPGTGPVRTGVTAILPRGQHFDPVFAAYHSFNGNGEMTGTAWVEESGFLEGPVLITNTHSVGVVRDAAIAWLIEKKMYSPLAPGVFWVLPVVAETYDGILNDINGFHVKPEHAWAALESATAGRVTEGNVGGGTGMICHGLKGGIGTASRRLEEPEGGHTVGVLVQANHGRRADLCYRGIPLVEKLAHLPEPWAAPSRGAGSIIVIVATDAPLLPHQLKRLAQRAPLGVHRVGAFGENTSGDLFLAFSTANPGAFSRRGPTHLVMGSNDALNALFRATVWAVEEAIWNALAAAETLTGVQGRTAHAIPHALLAELG